MLPAARHLQRRYKNVVSENKMDSVITWHLTIKISCTDVTTLRGETEWALSVDLTRHIKWNNKNTKCACIMNLDEYDLCNYFACEWIQLYSLNVTFEQRPCNLRRFWYFYIQLYSPHNMVAQANRTNKNTTNEIEKMTTVPLYTYKL